MTNQTPPQTYERQDLRQLVTDTIIEQLETGVVPWQQPWKGEQSLLTGLPYNTVTGNKYRGMNIVLLWCASIKNDYQTNEWGTFNHWKSKGEYLRKGEKFKNFVVKYESVEKEIDGEIQTYSYLKKHYVFNRCQLQSWKPMVTENYVKPTLSQAIKKSELIDNFVKNTQAIIEDHDGGACYKPLEDKIYIPPCEKFVDTPTCSAFEGYYSTILHELTHWSGAKHRLDRVKAKRFGDHDYAFEELIAEFGAAFLCAEFGISTLSKGDHAGYIDHWLKVLKENKDLLPKAASEASNAFDYLIGLQPKVS